MLRKITSIICVLIGVAVLIMGFTFNVDPADHSVLDRSFEYNAKGYDLTGAKFGADFYTYIYNGTDTIVDVLNDINMSMQTVVSGENGVYKALAANIIATDELNDTIKKIGKIIIISIGFAILAFGVVSFGKAFSVCVPKKAPEGPVTENVITDEKEEA
ncbi:MAG: hypothetical protein IKN92_05765 [Clostridia bacterium]|nr:hypothetical protein [Clostridia bacterium]